MTSAWGNSWGGAWGNSWGAVVPIPHRRDSRVDIFTGGAPSPPWPADYQWRKVRPDEAAERLIRRRELDIALALLLIS